MLRYGWPRWFTRTEPAFGSQLQPTITGHDAGMPYYFFPTTRVLDSLTRAGETDWPLDDPRAVSGYAPSFARSVHVIPGQVAAFRRGDSARIVATWDARRDTTLVGRDLDVALVIAGAADVGTIARAKGRNLGRIEAVAAVDSGLVSLELLAAEDKRAGRLRLGLPPRPRTGLALSDLLLYSPSDAPPQTLDAARDSALVSDVVRSHDRVGVFWETYGLPPRGEAIDFTLLVEQVGTSWARRAAERLGLAHRETATRIRWRETAAPVDGIAPRGVRVDLSGLRSGRYRVELTASAHGSSATTTRTIELRD